MDVSNLKNIVWHEAAVTREQREQLNGHKALVIWFTGLSGAGKSTLAHALDKTLHQQGSRSFVLDGDNVRHGLCSDLGFTPSDRQENMRRIAETARLFVEAGIISLAAFISPLREDRALVRQIVGPEFFLEVFVHCPLDVCEARDVKGMYRLARTGQIEHFTGISAPYEEPEHPDLTLHTERMGLEQCVEQVMALINGSLTLHGKTASDNSYACQS